MTAKTANVATDIFTAEKRSAIMRAVKSTNTGPEIKLRKALHALGYRYRVNVRDLPGKPDIVLPKHRTVIFVHGCFWHGHDCKRGARQPKSNRDYWIAKIARNKDRDQRNQTALADMGWRVIVVWACELKTLDPARLPIKPPT